MAEPNHVYIATGLDGVWLNAVAVVVASDAVEARRLLDQQLQDDGLHQHSPARIRIGILDTSTPHCNVVWNGDY